MYIHSWLPKSNLKIFRFAWLLQIVPYLLTPKLEISSFGWLLPVIPWWPHSKTGNFQVWLATASYTMLAKLQNWKFPGLVGYCQLYHAGQTPTLESVASCVMPGHFKPGNFQVSCTMLVKLQNWKPPGLVGCCKLTNSKPENFKLWCCNQTWKFPSLIGCCKFWMKFTLTS